MQRLETSYRLRKALTAQLGDAAGNELVDLLQNVVDRLNDLERRKVDVMPVVPLAPFESRTVSPPPSRCLPPFSAPAVSG